jgi:hypothetical protein
MSFGVRKKYNISLQWEFDFLTIDVPLFKKLRGNFFFAGQSLYEPFQGTF